MKSSNIFEYMWNFEIYADDHFGFELDQWKKKVNKNVVQIGLDEKINKHALFASIYLFF